MIALPETEEKVKSLVAKLVTASCPIEQGEVVLQMKDLGLSQWNIADLSKRKQTFISRVERLARLPAATLEAVRSGEISVTKALEAAKGRARFKPEGQRGDSVDRLIKEAESIRFSPGDFSPPKIRRGPWSDAPPSPTPEVPSLRLESVSDSSRAAAALEEIFLNGFQTLRLHHLELRFLERGILKDGDSSADLALMALERLKDALDEGDFGTPHGAVAKRIAESSGTARFLEIIFRLASREVGISSAELDYLEERVVKRG